jgi:hypothetical protein
VGAQDHAAMLELASEMIPMDALRFVRLETNDGASSGILLLMQACRAHPKSKLAYAMKSGAIGTRA